MKSLLSILEKYPLCQVNVLEFDNIFLVAIFILQIPVNRNNYVFVM